MPPLKLTTARIPENPGCFCHKAFQQAMNSSRIHFVIHRQATDSQVIAGVKCLPTHYEAGWREISR